MFLVITIVSMLLSVRRNPPRFIVLGSEHVVIVGHDFASCQYFGFHNVRKLGMYLISYIKRDNV